MGGGGKKRVAVFAAIVPPIMPTADNSTAVRYAFRAPAVFALRQTARQRQDRAGLQQVARARVQVARMPAHAKIPAAARPADMHECFGSGGCQ